MKNPIVSVICTNFNKAKWIEQALMSFLAQETNFEFEILVIDDASTDSSIEIIQKITNKNPEKIRFFRNEKNLGIAKTWKKICKKARGKYIARCDGDDFWISKEKLQKQFDLLERSEDSKWCNTEFRTEDEFGRVLFNKSFAEKFVEMPTNFTEMLILKGFTNASTWFIETDLVKEINETLNLETPDDTFNIQLELFAKTNLSTISEPMVVYRINKGSDSHPREFSQIEDRNNRLFKTQLEFIEKYKENINNMDAIKILLKKNTEFENLLEERNIAVLERDNLLRDRQKFIEEQGKIIQEMIDRKWLGLYKIIRKNSKKE